ncbi:MAG: betaine reductase complex component subunit beta [Thermovirga sp.]|jgi:glycine reductase|nr:MAG: Selenoprotein B, glycine/betaine/sarcosine/D-proline reductase family [Thermovirga lienii]MDN5318303.1 betaine reductase complex component subunit beta [Thermovirga sp.]MDN5367717.1 betaine reductase complex component subunit beta [Thermovirga sp.]
MLKAIHYINQFFGQVGGEDAADYRPTFHDELVGCSKMLNEMMDDVEVTHTIVCGDNYIASNTEEALKEIIDWLKGQEFDIFFAGPAFMAGRYGVGCGTVCKAVKETFGVPVITSMNEENPGVEMFHKDVYIFRGGRKATFMREDLQKMASFAQKIARNEELLPAEIEGYFPRGIRREIFHPEGIQAADRAVDMLLKKLKGEPFKTELPIPKREKVPVAPPIKDLSKATIALVGSSGVVPFDNPDRIQTASATKWGKYNIAGLDHLPKGKFKTIHAGYDPEAICEVPDRGMPVDAMRAYEKEGKIGKLHDYYYVTVGTGTTQAYAAKFGREIAAELKEAGVDGVLLVAT